MSHPAIETTGQLLWSDGGHTKLFCQSSAFGRHFAFLTSPCFKYTYFIFQKILKLQGIRIKVDSLHQVVPALLDKLEELDSGVNANSMLLFLLFIVIK
jgi:hypothetical protein